MQKFDEKLMTLLKFYLSFKKRVFNKGEQCIMCG